MRISAICTASVAATLPTKCIIGLSDCNMIKEVDVMVNNQEFFSHNSEMIMYQTEDGKTRIDVRLENDTV